MSSATSEKGIAKAKAKQALDLAAAKETITALMATVAGRRWMYNELAEARMFNVDTGLDFAQMAYDKGVRNTGLRWLALINRYCPAMYIRMMEEATNIKLDLEQTDDGIDGNSYAD